MPEAPISPKVREILKDPIKGRELVRDIIKLNPDKNGHQFSLKKTIQMKQKNKYVVYEHRKSGGRFMTDFTEGNIYKDDENHIIVEIDICEEIAKLLCEQRQENNIKSFLNNLPKELRNPETDEYIVNLIRNT